MEGLGEEGGRSHARISSHTHLSPKNRKRSKGQRGSSLSTSPITKKGLSQHRSRSWKRMRRYDCVRSYETLIGSRHPRINPAMAGSKSDRSRGRVVFPLAALLVARLDSRIAFGVLEHLFLGGAARGKREIDARTSGRVIIARQRICHQRFPFSLFRRGRNGLAGKAWARAGNPEPSDCLKRTADKPFRGVRYSGNNEPLLPRYCRAHS